MYYYEVIECGRRILLTGVLIFFAPGTAGQAAMACIFAFASLLGFELLRPHLDPADSWLYRLVSSVSVFFFRRPSLGGSLVRRCAWHASRKRFVEVVLVPMHMKLRERPSRSITLRAVGSTMSVGGTEERACIRKKGGLKWAKLEARRVERFPVRRRQKPVCYRQKPVC